MPRTEGKTQSRIRELMRSAKPRRDEPDFPVLIANGKTTHVLVPYEEYERMVVADATREAIKILDDPDTEWFDLEDVQREFAARDLAAARKAKGLTQKQLAAKVGLPQSQISRLERNPDKTTVRTLRKIAKALGVRLTLPA